MKYILGKKLGMTQIWSGDEVVAVTEVQAGPCTVTQIRNSKKDGYTAVQLGFGSRREKNIKKPQLGHLKDLDKHRFLREFRVVESETKVINRGDKIDLSTFAVGDIIKVTGTSKGKGFQGVVKRHGFHGQNATHGHKDQERMSGSIGAGGIQHVLKGTRMGGRMGGDRVTTSNLKIVGIDETRGVIMIGGSVPGINEGLVLISGDGELKLSAAIVEAQAEETVVTEVAVDETATVEEVVAEEVKTEEAAPTEEVKA